MPDQIVTYGKHDILYYNQYKKVGYEMRNQLYYQTHDEKYINGS